MRFTGSGLIETFSSNTMTVSYELEFPAVGNIGKIYPKNTGEDLLRFTNQKCDLRMEGCRLLEVSVQHDGTLIYSDGMAVGF